jgi:endonuclease/exonuclease/phosphatase family metal-dependent hydrolase
VRLATWNVLNGTGLSDGRVDAGRLRVAAASLGADVLGLQEVDRGQERSGGIDLVAEVARGTGAADWRFVPSLYGTPGGQWQAADGPDQGAGRAYGVGLVSQHPVRSWHELRLGAARVRSPIVLPGSRRVMWLQDEPRVAVAAVVEGPFGTMTVAATHLSFVPGWNVAQLRRVTRWLADLPRPHVLLGDLNMPPAVVRTLSPWTLLARTATYPSPEPKVQLDHVLGRGTLPPVRRAWTPVVPVSDHRPLVVELQTSRG